MIALVFTATAINYLDRQVLSIVAPFLIDLYRLNYVTYSRIVFAFMLAYTIMNGVSGRLIDRLGTRRGYAWTVGWWSGAAILHAATAGAWTLGIFRFLLGMGEAGNWPAGVKVVTEWFPVRERALASGIFNSGSAVGAILAPPLVAWTVVRFGWRSAFASVGICGFLWLLIWLLMYHTPTIDNQTQSRGIVYRPKELVQSRFFWSFVASKFFLDPVWYFYIFWFPAYLKNARHFDLLAIGKYAWIPFAVAGLGNIIGGWITKLLIQNRVSVSAARKIGAISFACMMTLTIPAVRVQNVDWSIALVSLAMMGYTGVTTNMLAMPADVFPSDMVATIWGYAGVGSGIGGMLFALGTGWLVDRYSYTPVFFAFGTMPLIAAFIISSLMGPLAPDRNITRSVPSPSRG